MNIRGILFDLGNVLIDYQPEVFITRLGEKSRIPLGTLIAYFLTSQADREYTEGKISSEEFFRRVSSDLKFSFPPDIFWDFWCHIFSEKSEMNELVSGLKKTYPVWVLSNTNASHFEFLRPRFPVLNNIDRFFLSYELGCQKPHAEIYERVIRETGFLPEEIFFTDDLERNVTSAEQAGMKTHRFVSAQVLGEELDRMGVKR